jgi:hypothetical protein
VIPPAGPTTFLGFLRARHPGIFAHHPAHPAFRDHVWTVQGLSFCKGCTVTFAGMVFGGLLYLPTRWLEHLSDIQVGLVFAALLLPTVASTLLPTPRTMRHVARFLLGVLLASAILMLFVTDSWPVRVAIVAVYLAVRVPLDRRRRRENAELVERWTRVQTPKRKEIP